MIKLWCYFFFFSCMLYANEIPQYNRYKTWKNADSEVSLQQHEKKLESFYKQVDRQSQQRKFVRFNGKRVVSHTEYTKMNLAEIHKYHVYIVLSEFYIQWVSPHNNLDGVSVGGILTQDAGDKKAQVRYFKFAQRYYSALHRLGKGRKVYAYCAIPYLTSCILTGIGEKW